MAIGTDNFNSYAVGDLTGNNGGTNWTGAWSAAVEFDVTTNTPQEGANCVEILSSTADKFATRAHTATASAVRSVYMRINGTTGWGDCAEREGVSEKTVVRFDGSGNIIAFSSGYVSNTIQAYSANTWYQIEIDYDISTDDFRVRVNGGTWTSRFTMVNGGATNGLDTFQPHKTDQTGSTFLFDNVDDTTPPAVVKVIQPGLLLMGVGL